ncbi:anthranilate synthase component I family protein [Streptomyces sp. NPDC058664]|uniref:anthranilate synthase component I family protein n=1 Tax=unclassified Streptomyces TaxID=2593676 RepID=UPI00365AC607
MIDLITPVFEAFPAGALTPAEAFERLGHDEPGFLLESMSANDGAARFSYVGHHVKSVNGGNGDPLNTLQSILDQPLTPADGLPPFIGGAVGYIGYEVARHFEQIPTAIGSDPGLPDSTFFYVDELAAFDHKNGQLFLITLHRHSAESHETALARIAGMKECLFGERRTKTETTPSHSLPAYAERPPWKANVSRDEFGEMVDRAREYIHAGDIFQVVLSQRFSKPLYADPSAVYRELRSVNPSPYMFHLSLGDGRHVVGASPELLVKVQDGVAETRPLAGTRWRGTDEASEDALEKELCSDEKERAEHVMLVDLGRNDIGKISVPGTVKVPRLMEVERYSHVMHLSSTVTGVLDTDRDCLDALRSTFPAGTVSGAPKIRAMEIIAEIEPERRGVYGGALGFMGFGGDLDFAIVLRTVVISDGMIYAQSGAGIVADSDAESEYQETLNKAKAVFVAVDRAERKS